jgi:hypothetical protein
MPTPIDPNAGYPSVQQAKSIQKYAPLCWQAFFGKKYILNNYRTPHYYRQDWINYSDWAMTTGLPYSDSVTTDEIMNATFCNIAASLHHGRPTLFLEVELEGLLYAELPSDMMSQDIKWKWPIQRIYLPKDLITLDKNERHYSLMYLDIGLLEAGQGRGVPAQLAPELNLYSQLMHPHRKPELDFSNFFFHYPDRAIILSGTLNCIDGLAQSDMTIYAMVKPFKDYTLDQVRKMTEHLRSAWECDQADDEVTAKMEHLALQILLFLSAYPLEYQPEQVLRKPAVHGERHISGLYAARYVGKSQIRPKKGEPHHIASLESVAAGWHLKHHWRCGHWKRQVCGPGFKDRKLIWVNTYEAGEREEEEVTK